MKTHLLISLFTMFISLCCAPLHAQSDINLSGYTQTFDEEFNSLSLTTSSPKGSSTWYYWPPYGAAGGYSASTWDATAFSVTGGILTDKAFLDSSNNWHSGNLSSMDTTAAGFAQQYGYFEIRCQMPSSGTGAWPAFWLQGTNSITNKSVNDEEIDIFEWYGSTFTNNQSIIQQASHQWNPDGSQGAGGIYSPSTPMPGGAFPWQGYHIYGCQVDPVHITWYIDGVQTNQCATPTSYVTSPFYMMVDYALGGGWPLSGMVNNSSLLVDWVRVYSLPASLAITSPTTATGTSGSTFSYQITATNSPTSFNAIGLPAGLSVNTGTGAITGTPTAAGISTVTLSATNASGTATATLTLTVSAAASSVVSINFAGPNASQQLQSTDVAGAPGYTAANWNVFTGANQTTSSPLKDGSGSTSAGVRLSSFASATATLVDPGSGLTPNQKLFAGIIQAYYAGSPAATISSIPYSTYDVVVYLESDSAGRTGSVSLSGSSTTYYYSTIGGASQPTAYTKVTSTTSGTYTTGNYVVFANQSGSSQTISLTPSNWSGICGIQIVGHAATPAPPVSINLTGPNTSQQLQATDIAGAPSYSVANWNVFTGANQTTSSLLKDSTGSTAAGVTLSSFASATATLIDPSSGLTPDQKLFAGIIQAYYAGSPAVTISAIPYSHYNVVVYLESDSSGRTGSVSLSGSSTTYYYSTLGGASQPASYIQVTSTTSGTYTAGNYVVFTGQSGSSKTISLTPSNWSGICGIQIVPQ